MRLTLAALAAITAVGMAAAHAAAPSPAYHLYRTPSSVVPPAAGQTMEYFGGSVTSNVNVVAVMWGPNVPASTVQGIGGFFSALVNSTYVDQLAQYSTVGITGVNGAPGTNQTIGRGTYAGLVTITPSNTATTLSDGAVRKELVAQIKAGKLPKPTPNTLYMTYFPSNIVITLGGGRSCVSFGAYHEAVLGKPNARNVFYGVMPDCGGGFSTITNVTSHEFAEAISDNIPTPGSNPAYPQAWNTSTGYEIGDLCEAYSGTLSAATGKSYTVQEVFLNTTGACGTGNFTSP
ncbi:MAG: hypothetical protein POG24_05070 [Acidocella sp.]|nr:hypothetical protein [Acidocella sp.]